MSELIAEARVLVTPDTTTFRSLLTTQLTAITRTLPPVPVAITPTVAPAAGAAALAAQEAQIAAATTRSADAIRGATDAKNAALASNRAYVRSLSGITSGAASAGLSLVGLRGATLAATGPFLAGAAGAIALGKAVGIATSFNSEIAVLGAVTGATGEQLELAAASAREFGRDITLPGVTAGDAAQTITEFSKAGLDLNDSLAATRGGLQLAQAAQISYADAVTLTANALNAFNLDGDEAVRVADTLANAANLAQGGIGDMALALRQAAGAAAVVGVSFEDTSALLTLLARNGLTGSDAGTALRTAFIRLVNPSKRAVEILDDLNVQLRDANGNVRPEVFAEFAAAQADLSQKTQQANAAIVFGQDAFRAFGFLGREGTEGLNEVQAGLERTGTAAEIAGARMTGLAGAQENLSNQLSALGETIGQKATPPLIILVNELAEFVAIGADAIETAAAVGGAIADLGADIAASIPGAGFIDDVFGFTNPITGITSPVRQIQELGDLFGIGADDTSDKIKESGADIKSAIEDASRQAARGALDFGDQIVRNFNTAFGAIRAAVEARAREFRQAQLGAVARGQGRAAGLEEVFDQVLAAGGSSQEQIAELQRQAANQARIIRDAGPNAAGVLLEARREAQAKLASINQQITGIEAQIAADAQRARDEQQRIRDENKRAADRDFLQQQEDARTRAEQRITVAEDTPALADDIRRQTELRVLIKRQIDALRASSLDEQAKQAAIRVLQAATFATTQAIKGLRRTQKEQREENRQAIFDQRAENASLRTQIAEARGADKDVIVQFIDQEIAVARQALARAKAAGKGILEATLELERLRQKKRELLEEAEEESDFTPFDILRENAETFLRTGGNLITGAQPFAGPTGFTADVAQFLTRPSTRVEMVQKPAPSAENLQRLTADRLAELIEALNRNTEAQTGNGSTATRGRSQIGFPSFYHSRTAEQLVDARRSGI